VKIHPGKTFSGQIPPTGELTKSQGEGAILGVFFPIDRIIWDPYKNG